VRLFGWRKRPKEGGKTPSAPPPELPVPPGLRLAQDLSSLWQAIDAIAREDGLTGKTAVEHFNLTAEGKNDVERWLNIYLKRLRPDHAYRLPAHYARHRGHCLIPRLWPDGLRWMAVNEETLLRAKIPEESDRAKLVQSLDRLLDRGG